MTIKTAFVFLAIFAFSLSESDEYLKIFKESRLEEDLKEKIEVVYPRAIKEYIDFIKKYPESHLVDDAKLRIAEFYNLTAAKAGEKELFPDIKFSDDWRGEANKWLKDIMANHPNDKISDPGSGQETGEPTAAFALYYLYVWNFRDPKYAKELLEKYPHSQPASWIRENASRPRGLFSLNACASRRSYWNSIRAK